MYNLLTLSNIEDYFQVQSKRTKKGVYFYRIIGYDEETLKFFRKYQTSAQRKGTYINQTIKNPDMEDIQYLSTIIRKEFELNENNIKQEVGIWLKFLSANQIKLVSESIYEVLNELQKKGININILKNTYIKFLYWLKYKFENSIKYIDQDEVPKILYEGDIGKNELYMLRVLSLAGCDVMYINFLSEESYIKFDGESKYSMRIVKEKRQIPQVHFSKIDLRAIEEKENMLKKINNAKINLNTNNWLTGDFLEAIYKENETRNPQNLLEINNMFIKYIGIDNKEEYNNRLYNLKKRLIVKGKKIILIEKQIENPTMEEVNKVRFSYKNKEDIVCQIMQKIDVSKDENINNIIKKEILEIINKYQAQNLAQIYNFGLKLLCWIERYCKKLFLNYDKRQLPILIYYGTCNKIEATFVCLMAKLPVDVIYISPNKMDAEKFKESYITDNAKIIELEKSIENMEFPKNEVKERASTVAYSAERELDQILYNDTGMYRNKQFKTCKSITLKTTYEEIAILWKEEAKFRPSFKVEENMVVVPNIFAKICGVKNSDGSEYLKSIQDMITEDTILIRKFPYIKQDAPNEFRNKVYKFLDNEKIKIEEIKKCKEYKYGFLNNNTQDYILSKIQEMINLKLILPNEIAINQKITYTLLNIDKQILRMIQQFDFTKNIPKIIIIDVDEEIPTVEDCILLLFLNLIGFDIIIYTPTGYQNIEKYINSNLYEEYQIGDYIYNLEIPKFKPAKGRSNKQNFFKDLFKRRN